MFVRRVKTWWQRNGDVVCFLLSLFAFRQLIPVSGRDGLHRAYISNEAVVCAAEGSSVEKTDDKINDRPYDSDLAVFLLLELGEFLVRQGSGIILFRLFSLIFHYAVLLVLHFHQIRSRFSGAIYIGVPSMCSVTVHSGSFSAPAETASERIILLIA